MKKFIWSFSPALIFLFSILLTSTTALGQKMGVEDIVAKHLESIGSAEDRKSLKNQVAVGLVQYTVLRQGGAGANGRIVIASEGRKILFGMTFAIPSYPAETIIYDGKRQDVAYAISNARSQLGDFIYRSEDILSENLLGGSLASGWALSDLNNRKAKLEFDGMKKINGREAFVLSFVPKGGSDLEIKIFIDKETFEHVRTEYRRVILQQSSGIDASASQREERQTMIEDFSNYQKEKGLNLPHSYRAYIKIDGRSGTRENEWKAEFSQFFFNQPLDPNSFVIGAKPGASSK